MVYIIIAVSIFFLEKKIKDYIEKNKEMHKKEKILKGHIILNRYHNRGIFLNVLEHNLKLVKTLSLVFLGLLILAFTIILPKKNNNGIKLALSLIIGGASSNTYDRFKRGYVVDYFSFKALRKIIFNISDICIFLGAALLLITSKFQKDI